MAAATAETPLPLPALLLARPALRREGGRKWLPGDEPAVYALPGEDPGAPKLPRSGLGRLAAGMWKPPCEDSCSVTNSTGYATLAFAPYLRSQASNSCIACGQVVCDSSVDHVIAQGRLCSDATVMCTVVNCLGTFLCEVPLEYLPKP